MDLLQLFIYFITVNKYRFCISVIGYINVQIIVSVIKNQYRSITSYQYEFSSQMACGNKNPAGVGYDTVIMFA